MHGIQIERRLTYLRALGDRIDPRRVVFSHDFDGDALVVRPDGRRRPGVSLPAAEAAD